MPIRVDHQARRASVTETAADIVVSAGPEALTVRAVAAAAGCSTMVVSHYFDDKRDLVRSVYRAAAARNRGRLAVATSKNGTTLVAALESLLPLDEPRRRDWMITCIFWGVAVADPELAAEQAERVRTAVPRIVAFLRRLDGSAHAMTGAQRSALARQLLTLVMGIATQAIFDPTYWTKGRQRTALREGITAILESPSAGRERPAVDRHDLSGEVGRFAGGNESDN
jgi:AcrR family transcriptional regulator